MPQKKIEFYGQYKPTGVPDGTADMLRGLAGLTSQIGEQAFKIGAQKRQAEGAREGLQVQRDEQGQAIAP